MYKTIVVPIKKSTTGLPFTFVIPFRILVHWHQVPVMPESNPSARIVLTTAANLDEARNLGRTLVEEGLAACATLIPAVESVYRWKGQLESSHETMLLLKTAADQLPALETRLHALHKYETPEFLVLDVAAGSPAYLQWMLGSLTDSVDPVVPPSSVSQEMQSNSVTD